MPRLATVSACCEPPALLDLATCAPRVRRMVEELVKHSEVIQRYEIGSVELHYHGQRVVLKLHLLP